MSNGKELFCGFFSWMFWCMFMFASFLVIIETGYRWKWLGIVALSILFGVISSETAGKELWE